MITNNAPVFDQHHDGFGVQSDRPRLSWSFTQTECSFEKPWMQVAYDIQIEDHVYHIDGPDSVLVPWPAQPLTSRQAVSVRVRCYGVTNAQTVRDQAICLEWSPWSIIEAGLLERTDWFASLITTRQTWYAADGSLSPVHFRKAFSLPAGNIRKARLYITSHGIYEADIDGCRIGDHCMSPGWTSYHHRLHYQVFDVKQQMHNTSDHVLSVAVGAGWYASALGWRGGRRCRYGDRLAVLVQLEVDVDGRMHRICSNESWTCSHSYITTSEIYNGEAWDLRLGSTAHGNEEVALAEFPTARLSTSDGPPVRVTQTLQPTNMFKTQSGKMIVDFGQNLAGRIRVKYLDLPYGSRITFRYAEIMEDGELGVRPLRTARNTDSIVFGKSALRDWVPKFTFHGFRFVEIDGWTSEGEVPLDLQSLEAEVLHTDLRRTGRFECSHKMLNKLHGNAVWSMRGNFLSLPTDCPQRDERLGWTGDIAIFAPSASFLYDVTGMLGNWLQDLAAEQSEPGRNGVPPLVVPGVIEKEMPDDVWWPMVPQAIWCDATILVPWSLYEASGDEDLLKRQFDSMKSWLDDGVRRGSDGLWDESIWQLGDWLDPTAPPDNPGNSRTDGTLVADAYLVHVTGIFEKVATIVGYAQPEARRGRRHEDVKRAFQDKYVTKKGLLVGDSQTALALAIRFDLRLARSVRQSLFKLATGFAGTPIICHALTESSQPQLAYRLILNKALPSWMYQVEQGATTIWERWDSLLPDGSINQGEMTSFNHYALGSVINWLHEYVGGISPISPGWKEVKIQPIPGATVTSGAASFESPYGHVACSWKVQQTDDGEKFAMVVIVPPNTRAYIILPVECIDDEEGGDNEGEIMHISTSIADQMLTVGQWVLSGKHYFECRYKSQPWPPQAILPPFWDQKQPDHV